YLFVLLTPILFLSRCAQPAEDTEQVPGVTDSTILIGTWGPLTGPAALWGNICKGMDAYFKMINDEGGIAGRKIELIIKDDAYDPSRTVPAVREMAQRDEVFAFVGGLGTAPGMAVMDFIVENDIPWISPISGSHQWAFPPKENIFALYPLYFDEAQMHVDYAVGELGAEKIAIIYQNDDFGKSGLVATQYALEQREQSLVAEVSVEVTDTDLGSHAARLQDAGAEVVLLWVTPRQGAIIMGATRVVGYQPQWIASTVLSDMPLMHDITRGAWEGVIFTYFGQMPQDTSGTEVNRYRAAFNKYYPDVRWGSFPYVGYFFSEPFVEALRRAGEDLNRASLLQAMESLDGWEGTGPPISFGPESRLGLRSAYLVKCLSATDYEKVTDLVRIETEVEKLVERLE
ncbi:MAG: ABC transporter substrate-binding protein, partial [Saprospiraceae bacterium]|nr:ABC transporter substrate-binding protein [Saprospiraceae bacterium]